MAERIPLMGGVPREQKMLTGHLPRVKYHLVYQYTKSAAIYWDLRQFGPESCRFKKTS